MSLANTSRSADASLPLDALLDGLRAAGERTRLRLLVLCAHADLTVSQLVEILGQSQPRVSRHLKMLCDAGLLDRLPEGSWVYYRLAQQGEGARLAQLLIDLADAGDPVIALDLDRLQAIQRRRAEVAGEYFSRNAPRWHEIRSLHVDEAVVEATLRRLVGSTPVEDMLDIGTGTGRMLEVLGPHVQRAVGIDASRDMLAVARVNLEQRGLRHCAVRLADMYQLPFAGGSMDLVTVHQVLRYAERPAQAIREAARVLRPGGRLLVVDFASHRREELRDEHRHVHLGFGDEAVHGWLADAGLLPEPPEHLPGDPLTVVVWHGRRPPAAGQPRLAAVEGGRP